MFVIRKSFMPDGRVVRALDMKPWEKSVLRGSLNSKKANRLKRVAQKPANDSWRGQRVVHPSHGPMTLTDYVGNGSFRAIGRGDTRHVVNRANVKFTRRKK